jgi:general stress protein YciG
MKTTSRPKGFAAMSKAKQRAIARLGGLALSKNVKHMVKIGRKGGRNSHKGDWTFLK